MELEKPDGSSLTPADTNGTDVFYVSYPEFGIKYFSLNHPQNGKWKVKINGDYFLPDTSYKLVYPMSVNNWLVVKADTFWVGAQDSALITARLYDQSMEVSDVSMECYYYDNHGQRQDITLNDDGLNGDAAAGDGVYSGYFHPRSDYGAHRINAILRGNWNGNQFYRQQAVTVAALTPAPLPYSPYNGQSGLDTTAVSLTWQADTLHERYELMVADDSLFASLAYYASSVEDTAYFISDLLTDHTYYWKVRGFGAYGASEWSETWSFHTKTATGIADRMPHPKTFRLYQNYPNPFNPSTSITYDLPRAVKVRLDLFNVLGQKVLTLVDGRQQAGRHSVKVQLQGFASGVYYYRLKAGSFVRVKRMILMK